MFGFKLACWVCLAIRVFLDLAVAENRQRDHDCRIAGCHCSLLHLVLFPPEERQGSCYPQLGTPVNHLTAPISLFWQGQLRLSLFLYQKIRTHWPSFLHQGWEMIVSSTIPMRLSISMKWTFPSSSRITTELHARSAWTPFTGISKASPFKEGSY